MRLKTLIKVLSFGLLIIVMEACLKGDPMNFPPGAQHPFMIMTNNADGTANNPVSGLRYFGNQSLLYAHDDDRDTATFFVALEGTGNAGRDINVTLTTPTEALDDNYSADSLTYLMMPDSLFDFVNTTAVISAGKAYAKFQVVFYPSKFDQSQTYMLPISTTNDANIPYSSNYGTLYYHVIGNPIAGAYSWDFIRCSTPDCSGGPDGQTFYGHATSFAPASPTFVKVATGYYTGPDYFITFKNTGGVLSDFKVVIDPAEVSGTWASNGIYIVTGPTILVENNNTKFTINYTTLTRNCTDVYYK